MHQNYFEGVRVLNEYYEEKLYRTTLRPATTTDLGRFLYPDFCPPPKWAEREGDVLYNLEGYVSYLPAGKRRKTLASELNGDLHAQRTDYLFRWLCQFPVAFRQYCGVGLTDKERPLPRASLGISHIPPAPEAEAAASSQHEGVKPTTLSSDGFRCAITDVHGESDLEGSSEGNEAPLLTNESDSEEESKGNEAPLPPVASSLPAETPSGAVDCTIDDADDSPAAGRQ
jgi:hypothetical protein